MNRKITNNEGDLGGEDMEFVCFYKANLREAKKFASMIDNQR